MSVSATPAAQGSQAATLATDYTLATINTPGTFVLNVDTTPLANGETLILTMRAKAITGGGLAVVYQAVYVHAQGEPLKISPPMPSAFSCDFTLRQEGGTTRTFDWRVDKID